MKNTILLSIIVPTYNSKENIQVLLHSLQNSVDKRFEVIINDDKNSKDNIQEILREYTQLEIRYLQKNVSMAQARKSAAAYAKGKYLLHLDSDMEVSRKLIGEIITLLDTTYDALVIDENSVGDSFWARCKGLEKKFYTGVEEMESLRAVKKAVYKTLGGHDKRMVFSEDKDFDLRVRNAGYLVGRAKNTIIHHEGKLSLFATCLKKMKYSATANIFFKKHPKEAAWQANILNRYIIFLKHGNYFLVDPVLFTGMIFMKNVEVLCGGIGICKRFVQK